MSEDGYIGLAAIFVSCVALASAIYEGIANRRHNRLSIKPHLTVAWNNVDEHKIDLYLINAGLGSAIIEEFEVCFNGGIGITCDWATALENSGLGDYVAEHYTMYEGEAIGPGDKVLLLNLVFPSKEHKDAADMFSKFYMKTTYKSLYGEAGRAELSCNVAKTI